MTDGLARLIREARNLPLPGGRIRLLLFCCAVTALLLVVPLHLPPPFGVLAPVGVVALALAAAALPDGPLPAVVMYTVAVCWVGTTTFGGQRVDLLRLVVLTCLTYLVHTLAALAAFVPPDAVLPQGSRPLRRTLVRAGWVLAATAAVGALTASALTLLDGRTSAVAPFGVVAALVAAAFAGRRVLRSPARATAECPPRGDDSPATSP